VVDEEAAALGLSSSSKEGERFIINFSLDYPFFPIHVMKSIMYVAIDGGPDEWKSIILLPFGPSKYVRVMILVGDVGEAQNGEVCGMKFCFRLRVLRWGVVRWFRQNE
jgi:hypothetical protein